MVLTLGTITTLFNLSGGSVQLITIGSISLERYQALYKPFEKKYVVTRIKISIITSWTVGIVCMILTWTFFQDSPTLILCDRSNIQDISRHLSYKLGIYIFVPLTFISVFIILIFYGRILYLIQKHVKSTEKTLRDTKKIKKNKVAPQKKNPKKVIDAMVNNFMPPGFSIIDNGKGSRISLISIGKDNSDKRDVPSAMDVYNESNSKQELTLKENNRFVVTEEKQYTSHTLKTCENNQISTVSEKVDILPTIQSVGSLKSVRNNSSRELLLQDISTQRTSEILSVQNLESAGSKWKETVSSIRDNHSSSTQLDANENESNLDDPNKNVNKPGTSASPNDNYIKCKSEGPVPQTDNNSDQGKTIGLTNGANQCSDDEATQSNDRVITDLFTAKQSPLTTRQKRDREYVQLDGASSERLRMLANDHESTSQLDRTPSKDGGYVKLSFSKADHIVADNDTVNRRDAINAVEEKTESSDDKNTKPTTDQRQKPTGENDPGKNKGEGNRYGSGSTTKETELMEINYKPVSQAGEEKDKLKTESLEAIRTSKAAKRKQKDSALKSRISVVKIYDADGQTVQAKTSNQTVTGDICVINTSNKIKGKRKMEAKSAKRTAVVLATFLIAWLPFPIIIIVSWYLHADSGSQIQALISAYIVSMTLSLLAASVNPLVYGAINKQFYKEFKKMFKKCKQKCSTKTK